MHKLTVPLVLSVFLLIGCDDKKTTPTGPTGMTPQSVTVTGFSTLAVTPDTLTVQPVRNPFCPPVAPFTAPFTLIVRNGDVSLTIVDITMRFTDSFGIRMPPVTLTAPMLSSQFGATRVPPGSARSFPLSLDLGCGASPSGTLTIIVSTRDDNDRRGTLQVNVGVH
jgi:hypothetical protein